MALPLVFTLPPSNRHEIILLDTSSAKPPTLKALNKQITDAMAGSPNCAEFLSKYKSATPEPIQEIRIHWSTACGRDRAAWPEHTVVTDRNWGAIIELLKVAPGKDVLEIKMGTEGVGAELVAI
ncbi:hypothetical protein BDV95DRAFT_160006 [Massariosphaeria phaeospora]|uniref:Uncharacterized protein n=1 Tax=Massariosphaeria phaeospora TaxID=100035 RepID=A0A7C8MAH3_9PLEO|nr:hypothetical protein BDV95DRAFT_160006 [Massariosphaeria phaeospora]